ncbi:Vps55p [Rhizophagus irregularis DAOM 197198w]|uniref:Vps55p n=1 Tax=Rhizophagus irregularis (strain DAOM 197198w) TaxID=1432141 RepID=A0A015KDE8_RHIIW|nr:Vps55p [Rhizophagus irregularis DAOM 197198w]
MAGVKTNELFSFCSSLRIPTRHFIWSIISVCQLCVKIGGHCLSAIATYVLAPLPNFIFSRCGSNDDYLDYNNSNGYKDFGRFLTAILIVTGVCLPIVLAHSHVITIPAMIMSTGGGALVYSTIIAYAHFFSNEGDDF